MKLKNAPINVTFPLLNLKTWLGQVLMSICVVPALHCKKKARPKVVFWGCYICKGKSSCTLHKDKCAMQSWCCRCNRCSSSSKTLCVLSLRHSVLTPFALDFTFLSIATCRDATLVSGTAVPMKISLHNRKVACSVVALELKRGCVTACPRIVP